MKRRIACSVALTIAMFAGVAVFGQIPGMAPPKRLVGWAKVELAPGESKQVEVPVSRDRLMVFDEESDSWKLVPGEYVVRAGTSSQDLPLKQTISF